MARKQTTTVAGRAPAVKAVAKKAAKAAKAAPARKPAKAAPATAAVAPAAPAAKKGPAKKAARKAPEKKAASGPAPTAPAKKGTKKAVTAKAAARAAAAGPPPGGRGPNILVIWGDDIGITNLSCYSDGLMGYRTPNIDRLADEGVRFTDYYGEQSCTAGRAAFLTGQSVFRTGLSKVGFPGADLGLRKEDPTIAEALKPLGYATGQFGKNHFGDKDEFLPTLHGFDEFFGNLYHLNAEEDPEQDDYPSPEDYPNFRRNFGPRGVLHCWAEPDGTQRIEDTGPLTRLRMQTIDDEVLGVATDFIERQAAADTPFFVWFNTTHMHFRTHPRPEVKGLAGRWQSDYHDVMVDHDRLVGELLAVLDRLGLAEDTIVMYSTDNGPHMNTWPDGGMTPFRNEKNSNWEGAYRVPSILRWPGRIRPGWVSNEIVAHLDMFPTLVAAAGDPDVAERLKAGTDLAGKHFKVHLDGQSVLEYLTGQEEESPREGFFYFSDDGDLTSVRFDNWKLVFMEQRAPGTLRVWAEPFVPLRVPKIFNLRTDPFERADITSNGYYDWLLERAYMVMAAQRIVADFLATFQEFPPRQKAATFTIDQVMEKMQEGIGSH
ncbi:arylsulfatase [Catellatospora sp. TT07R-123]|uniref:arylsulfatase n=1 Tax=Catellatospora sp. TT07R-123 TaxID=2733863 RepID=UPI001B01A92D|nr:arylsulfatase [Catellatospora sp. TT07R-123]GHJ50066.1 arylsulfatase [Catellatospora sp. TT07R-123]